MRPFSGSSGLDKCLSQRRNNLSALAELVVILQRQHFNVARSTLSSRETSLTGSDRVEEDKELERIRGKKLNELMEKSKKAKTSGVVTLESSNFDTTIENASKPVLIDFWAGWCMPCKVMAPIIEEMASDLAGKAILAKVNVDENPEISQRFNIVSIPHFIIFMKGKPVERIVGAVGRGPLEEALTKHLEPHTYP